MSDETTKDPSDKPVDETTDPTAAEQAAVEEVFAEAADAPAEEPQSAKDPVAELKSQVADAERRVLLAQADLENFRKRARRNAEDGVKYATLPLIREMLPCIDNLQRAIEAQEQAEAGDAAGAGMLDGVKMVSQQLMTILAQHNCKVIDGTGEFDPNFHEAVMQQPSDEHPSGTVIQVTQTGYQLHDRVIRPAQVIVSKGSA